MLSLGDDEARALGVDVAALRAVVIGAATLMTASVVAISGVIGWIGLMMPHIARMLVGPNFDRLLPAAMLLGAAFMLLVDTLARSIARVETPLGILTAVLGAPFFLWLLARGRRTGAGADDAASADNLSDRLWRPRGRQRHFARLVPGEVLCLLGPNGAGKTTLFRTLLGLQPPLAGAMPIDGVPLAYCGPPTSPSGSPMCRRPTSPSSPTRCSTWC